MKFVNQQPEFHLPEIIEASSMPELLDQIDSQILLLAQEQAQLYWWHDNSFNDAQAVPILVKILSDRFLKGLIQVQ